MEEEWREKKKKRERFDWGLRATFPMHNLSVRVCE